MATFTRRRIGGSVVLTAILAIALSGTLSAGTNQWTSIGPDGGTVQSLAADPRNPSTV